MLYRRTCLSCFAAESWRCNLAGIGHTPTKFTLVECLVVISGIALLIALLMPALSFAVNQAKCVSCLNNQKQNYGGMLSYVSDSYGKLPPPWVNDAGTMAKPYNLQISGNGDPLRFVGLGLVVSQGYASNQTIYCAGRITIKDTNAALSLDQWRGGYSYINGNYNIDYMIYPYSINLKPPYPVFRKFPPRKLFTVDCIGTYESQDLQHEASFNFIRGDGSGSSLTSEYIYNMCVLWGDSSGNDSVERSWTHFEPLITILEKEK